MRPSILIPGLLSLTAAIPYDSTASPGTSSLEAPATLHKRGNRDWICWLAARWTCQETGTAYGPGVNPDTVGQFKSYKDFANAAKNAVTPSGYVSSFQNADGATSTSNYLGQTELQSYDPATCAAKCDPQKGCIAFNIWFERDPSTTTDPYCCPNPDSVTRIKCSWWGTYTTSTTADNKGQKRDQFHVVMAGSNGYNKQVDSTGSSSSASNVRSSSSSTGSLASTARSSSTRSSASSTLTPSSSASISRPSTSASSASVASSVSSMASSFARTSSSLSSASGASSMSSSAASPSSEAGARYLASSAAQISSSPSLAAESLVSSSKQASASDAPSVTSSPSATTSSSSASIVSNSATVASANAETTVTDPGSPVTQSIASSATTCATPVATPELTFNLDRTTKGAETIWMYGSIPQLGNWNVDDAVPLSAYDYTPSNTNWFATLKDIAQGTYFEYKYFQRNEDWSITWPPVDNRVYTTPTGCQSKYVINDSWQ